MQTSVTRMNVKMKPYIRRYITSILEGAKTIKKISPVNLASLTGSDKKKFLDSFDVVITDCDGVLWHSENTIPGAIEVMNALPSLNKKRFFITNNGVNTRKELVNKFKSLGFDTSEEEVLGTSWLTAQYLKNINFNKKVYLIASEGIKEELDNAGIINIGSGPDKHYSCLKDLLDDFQIDPDVGAVIAGSDYHFSYTKLVKANLYLRNPEVLYIATNTDGSYPAKGGLLMPGGGAFVAAVTAASGRTPSVVGKPSPLVIDQILVPAGVNPNRCLMIGDRCNTDIEFGNRRGMTTLLVLTGVHKIEHVNKFQESNQKLCVPTYYASSIKDLFTLINN